MTETNGNYERQKGDPRNPQKVRERMLEVLDDGHLHPIAELIRCLDDPEFGEVSTVRFHISNLRKDLQPRGLDVLCTNGAYRLVRHLGSAYRG